MCRRCVDAARMHFPGQGDQAISDLLWNATCFPSGGPEQVERQIHEMALRSGRDVRKAIDLAWEDACAAMDSVREGKG